MNVRRLLPFLLAVALAAGCGPSRTKVHRDAGTDAGGEVADAGVPDAGTDGGSEVGTDGGPDGGSGDRFDGGVPAVLRVGSWNVEWFGDPANGPRDEQLQQDSVRSILQTAGMDLYGLVEVVNPNGFSTLLAGLPEYRGFLASDTASVSQPVTCYTSGSTPCYTLNEQKLAFVYKRSVVTVRGAQLILAGPSYDYAFAGRPPLRVDVTVNVRGFSTDLVVIVVHLKASATGDDWQRRNDSATALKQYLDANLANQRVLVIGDWNDDVDESIVSSGGVFLPTPFQQFVGDRARYTFVTELLTVSGAQSTVKYPNVIDHHLATQPMQELYLSGSVAVVRPDRWGDSSYGGTAYLSVSDHYPIESDYLLGVAPAPADGGLEAGSDAGP